MVVADVRKEKMFRIELVPKKFFSQENILLRRVK